jgi:FkbH-like protein
VDLESYLASLGTKLTIYKNDRSIIPRMAQLTQKTNQFNLTTRRYTETDIARFIDDERTTVFAFGVSDKFGDSGITGLCIVRIDGPDTAVIDSLLMSCRVLGRNVEYAFLDWLIAHLRDREINQVTAHYIPTAKNMPVEEFFDRSSFLLNDSSEMHRSYFLNISRYTPKPIDYVEISDGRSYQECYGSSL